MSTIKLTCVVIAFISGYVVNAQSDKPECSGKEPVYLERIKGFYLSGCASSDYNEAELYYTDLKGSEKTDKRAGKYYRLSYSKDEKYSNPVSGAYIKNNYANAVKKAGGMVLSSENEYFRFSHNGADIYMLIEYADDVDDHGFVISIVEVEVMKQEVKLNIQSAIDKDGKAVLYGILFDVDKAVIKPESEAELKQITAYLKNNPSVKIYVVGHTDNSGIYANNLRLSKERATAVKDYLTSKGGIDATRIMAEGVASLCPVSTNATPAGKALNRRVEIVKQ